TDAEKPQHPSAVEPCCDVEAETLVHDLVSADPADRCGRDLTRSFDNRSCRVPRTSGRAPSRWASPSRPPGERPAGGMVVTWQLPRGPTVTLIEDLRPRSGNRCAVCRA